MRSSLLRSLDTANPSGSKACAYELAAAETRRLPSAARSFRSAPRLLLIFVLVRSIVYHVAQTRSVQSRCCWTSLIPSPLRPDRSFPELCPDSRGEPAGRRLAWQLSATCGPHWSVSIGSTSKEGVAIVVTTFARSGMRSAGVRRSSDSNMRKIAHQITRFPRHHHTTAYSVSWTLGLGRVSPATGEAH